MSTVWLIFRLIDIACLGAVVSGVIWRWEALQLPRWPWFRWGMVITFAAGMYGNAGRIWINAPGGWWIAALTVGYLILAVGCYRRTAAQFIHRILTKPDRSTP